MNTFDSFIYDNTFEFIKKFLIPSNCEAIFNPFDKLPNYEQIKIARDFICSKVFDEDICEYINLNYKGKNGYHKFLTTRYWEIISYIKKFNNNFCEICGDTKHLQVHHKTYKRHGLEHTEDVIQNDLQVLCEECHKKAHSKVV